MSHVEFLQDETEVLHSGLLEELRVKDTIIPCSRFLSLYKNPTTFKSALHEQYQVKSLLPGLPAFILKILFNVQILIP